MRSCHRPHPRTGSVLSISVQKGTANLTRGYAKRALRARGSTVQVTIAPIVLSASSISPTPHRNHACRPPCATGVSLRRLPRRLRAAGRAVCVLRAPSRTSLTLPHVVRGRPAGQVICQPWIHGSSATATARNAPPVPSRPKKITPRRRASNGQPSAPNGRWPPPLRPRICLLYTSPSPRD